MIVGRGQWYGKLDLKNEEVKPRAAPARNMREKGVVEERWDGTAERVIRLSDSRVLSSLGANKKLSGRM